MKKSFDDYAKGPWRCKTCERPWRMCICPDELKPESRGGLKKRINKNRG